MVYYVMLYMRADMADIAVWKPVIRYGTTKIVTFCQTANQCLLKVQ